MSIIIAQYSNIASSLTWAYQHLAEYIRTDALQNPRSIVLATYSLCGFAHITSLAIFIGGISVLAPSRVKDLARVGFRPLLAASLACLMTGAVAGIFFRVGDKETIPKLDHEAGLNISIGGITRVQNKARLSSKNVF